MSGAIAGTRILDVTQVVAGSFSTMMLGELGADVVKIERPEIGDIGRSNPPFVENRSAYFMSVNSNKKSVTLDLKSERGRETFLTLAEKADVIVENLKPGAMKSFGLEYEQIQEKNESIIYCSISGFGQTGPHAKLPALDIIIQAYTGNMSITGPENSQPYRSGIPIGDIAGSMYATQSVLAALYHREQTGKGQYIDVAMADGLMSWLTVRAGYTFGTGEPYPRRGNRLDEFVPYGVFETEDSYIVIAAVQDHHWQILCQQLGMAEIANDPNYATMEARRENRKEVERHLEREFVKESTRTWFNRLSPEVPVAPINDTKDILNDEHVDARKLIEEQTINGTTHSFINHPVKFSETPARPHQTPPELGEHTVDELREAGYSKETIQKLRDANII